MKLKLIGVFLVGVTLGVAVTLLLAASAVQRRDAFLMSVYHGLEGAAAVEEERKGNLLNAYVHQSNFLSIMRQREGALALNHVPWTFFAPISSAMQALLVPTPEAHWNEGLIESQQGVVNELGSRLLKFRAKDSGVRSEIPASPPSSQ